MRSKVELRRVVGGKWFLEKRSMALLIPFLLATSILSALAQLTSLGYQIGNYLEIVTKLTSANLLALLACWALIEIFDRSLLSSKSKTGTALPVVISLSFAIGVTKGLVTGLVAFSLGVFGTLEQAIGLKWLQTGILGVLLLPSLSLLAHGLEGIRNKSDLLVAERVQQILGKVESGHPSNSIALQTFKKEALGQISALEKIIATNPQKADSVIEGVRQLIDSHLRPLSHRIARERQANEVRIDLDWAIRSIFGGQIVGFLVAYFVIFITLFMGYLQVQTPEVAFSQSLLTSFAIGLLCSALYFLRPRNLIFASFLLIGVTGLGSFLGISTSELLVPSVNQIDFVTLGLVVWLLVLQNILFLVPLALLLRKSRLIDIELEQLFAEADLDSRAKAAVKEITNRNLAQYLHSDVQNKLLSVALLLANGVDKNPTESIAKLRDVIEGMDGKSKSESEFSWESLCETVVEDWGGFLEVEFELDPNIRKSLSKPNSLIFEIIMEGLSNALRHGNASRSRVEISPRGSDSCVLELKVTDDGFGPKNGKRGLGCDLFERASNGNWSLHALSGGGSLLICAIPVSQGLSLSRTRSRR